MNETLEIMINFFFSFIFLAQLTCLFIFQIICENKKQKNPTSLREKTCFDNWQISYFIFIYLLLLIFFFFVFLMIISKRFFFIHIYFFDSFEYQLFYYLESVFLHHPLLVLISLKILLVLVVVLILFSNNKFPSRSFHLFCVGEDFWVADFQRVRVRAVCCRSRARVGAVSPSFLVASRNLFWIHPSAILRSSDVLHEICSFHEFACLFVESEFFDRGWFVVGVEKWLDCLFYLRRKEGAESDVCFVDVDIPWWDFRFLEFEFWFDRSGSL